MVMMLLGLKSSYLFPGIKCVKPLIISARDTLTSKKGLRWQRGGGLLKSREGEGRSMQALSFKERLECENIRHADGGGDGNGSQTWGNDCTKLQGNMLGDEEMCMQSMVTPCKGLCMVIHSSR